MGDDLTVVNAARVSFDKESILEYVNTQGDATASGFELTDKDTKLIQYLAKHGHWTPFSHPQITMRYTVPIFIARQEFKHIVGFTRNEVSRRYVDDTPEFYTPKVWRSRPEGSIKQGSGSGIVEGVWDLEVATGAVHVDELDGSIHDITTGTMNFMESQIGFYEQLIEVGVAPEQARMVLPQSMYTSYYITGSLAAFARMVKQRSDPHAQVEIQELAGMVDEVIRPLFPVSWEALTN